MRQTLRSNQPSTIVPPASHTTTSATAVAAAKKALQLASRGAAKIARKPARQPDPTATHQRGKPARKLSADPPLLSPTIRTLPDDSERNPGPQPYHDEHGRSPLPVPPQSTPCDDAVSPGLAAALSQSTRTLVKKPMQWMREVRDEVRTWYAIQKARAGMAGKEVGEQPAMEISVPLEIDGKEWVGERMGLCSREVAMASGRHRHADYVLRERQRTLERLEGEW